MASGAKPGAPTVRKAERLRAAIGHRTLSGGCGHSIAPACARPQLSGSVRPQPRSTSGQQRWPRQSIVTANCRIGSARPTVAYWEKASS